jgi:hypothetical protein
MENKKPGRPKREFPTISVHIRLDPEILESVEEDATYNGYYKNNKPNVSRMIKEILKEKYN